RDEAAPFWKPAGLGAEIYDRRSLGPRRPKAPPQLRQFDTILTAAKDGSGLGRPDVVARLQIRGCCGEYHGQADLAEGLQVGTVGHVISKVVAQGQTCG